jgi:hypothetical protein
MQSSCKESQGPLLRQGCSTEGGGGGNDNDDDDNCDIISHCHGNAVKGFWASQHNIYDYVHLLV